MFPQFISDQIVSYICVALLLKDTFFTLFCIYARVLSYQSYRAVSLHCCLHRPHTFLRSCERAPTRQGHMHYRTHQHSNCSTPADVLANMQSLDSKRGKRLYIRTYHGKRYSQEMYESGTMQQINQKLPLHPHTSIQRNTYKRLLSTIPTKQCLVSV